MRRCPDCNKRLRKDATNCPRCGWRERKFGFNFGFFNKKLAEPPLKRLCFNILDIEENIFSSKKLQ